MLQNNTTSSSATSRALILDMPHHKKPRLGGPAANAELSAVVAHNAATTANELSGDIVAIIFGCFPPEDIMRMRRVCKKWREAAQRTIVPPDVFRVNSLNKYNSLVAMTTALPNLQQLSIGGLGPWLIWSNGEDPDEHMATAFAHFTTHDINIISNFRKLRSLHIETVYLNGRYPVLFDFPLLCELRVTSSDYLKFDLGMLSAGCPSLKVLNVTVTKNLSPYFTGNIRSLRVLKDTLEMVEITCCERIEGNFMDLADFPRLKKLDLWYTQVTGDIRDICKKDFPALEILRLPKSVRGSIVYKFQHVSEVPSFMHTMHLLLQRNPDIFKADSCEDPFHWSLSEDSPDWYDQEYDWYAGGIGNPPPFFLQIIRAGSRLGWSWYSDDYHSCEINWLDPEPSSESSGYEDYTEELQLIEGELDTDFYRGYHEPPTEMEYRRLCEGLEQRD